MIACNAAAIDTILILRQQDDAYQKTIITVSIFKCSYTKNYI